MAPQEARLRDDKHLATSACQRFTVSARVARGGATRRSPIPLPYASGQRCHHTRRNIVLPWRHMQHVQIRRAVASSSEVLGTSCRRTLFLALHLTLIFGV